MIEKALFIIRKCPLMAAVSTGDARTVLAPPIDRDLPGWMVFVQKLKRAERQAEWSCGHCGYGGGQKDEAIM